MKMTKQELARLDGSLVYMPDNNKIRLGTVVDYYGSVKIKAVTSDAIDSESSWSTSYSTPSQELYGDSFEVYVICKVKK